MTNNATLTQPLSKKEARKIVYEKLASALSEFKNDLKEKKFTSKLKKASKLFAADIAKTIGKKKEKAQKQSKKKLKVVETEKAAQKAS